MNRLDALLFVGFNKRVAALDRESGELRWQWRAPKGSSYVSLLLDGDCLFVSVNGYLYCLDAATGEQLWLNQMRGFGTGVTSLASTRGHTDHAILGQAASADAAAAASSAGT